MSSARVFRHLFPPSHISSDAAFRLFKIDNLLLDFLVVPRVVLKGVIQDGSSVKTGVYRFVWIRSKGNVEMTNLLQTVTSPPSQHVIADQHHTRV